MSEDLKFWISIAQWLFMLGIGFYVWLTNQQAATAKDMAEIATRVTTLEEQMRHLPDQALVNEVAGDMKAVKAELAGIRESIVPLTRSMDRMHSYLLNRK